MNATAIAAPVHRASYAQDGQMLLRPPRRSARSRRPGHLHRRHLRPHRRRRPADAARHRRGAERPAPPGLRLRAGHGEAPVAQPRRVPPLPALRRTHATLRDPDRNHPPTIARKGTIAMTTITNAPKTIVRQPSSIERLRSRLAGELITPDSARYDDARARARHQYGVPAAPGHRAGRHTARRRRSRPVRRGRGPAARGPQRRPQRPRLQHDRRRDRRRLLADEARQHRCARAARRASSPARTPAS